MNSNDESPSNVIGKIEVRRKKWKITLAVILVLFAVNGITFVLFAESLRSRIFLDHANRTASRNCEHGCYALIFGDYSPEERASTQKNVFFANDLQSEHGALLRFGNHDTADALIRTQSGSAEESNVYHFREGVVSNGLFYRTTLYEMSLGDLAGVGYRVHSVWILYRWVIVWEQPEWFS